MNVFLHQYKAPEKELRRARDIVTLHLLGENQLECDPFHTGGRIFSSFLKNGERAIIVSLRLTYCANNTGRDVHFEVQSVFAPRKGSSAHPDVTGTIRLVIPARHHGSVPETSQIVYRPNLVNLGIPVLQYAGMEEAILNTRSSAIVVDTQNDESGKSREYQIFQQCDPLLVFMLRHAHVWTRSVIGPQDILQLKSGFYRVSTKAIAAAQSVFRSAIFPLFCYTHAEHQMRLVWNHSMEPPPLMPAHLVDAFQEAPAESGFALVVFELEMEYVVVSNGLSTFSVVETQLI